MSATFDKLYLVSQSPRRRELLRQVAANAEVLLLRNQPGRPSDVDETPLPGETPADYVVRLARAKAEMGWQRMLERRLPRLPVLGADTTVSVDGDIIGKPASREEAEAALRRLSGREHEVLTGVALAFEGRVESRLSLSTVRFRVLSEAAIRRYVLSGESRDKAGAYGIQGRAAAFVSHLSGSYSGVMGLPLCETTELLDLFGVTYL